MPVQAHLEPPDRLIVGVHVADLAVVFGLRVQPHDSHAAAHEPMPLVNSSQLDYDVSRRLYLHVAWLACAEDTASYGNLRDGRLECGHHKGLHRPSAKPGSLRPAIDIVQHRTDRVG